LNSKLHFSFFFANCFDSNGVRYREALFAFDRDHPFYLHKLERLSALVC